MGCGMYSSMYDQVQDGGGCMSEIHDVAKSIGYRDFNDMVDSNYTKDEVIAHIVEYLKKESAVELIDMLVEYLYNDKEYDIRDLFFTATGAWP